MSSLVLICLAVVAAVALVGLTLLLRRSSD